MTDLREVQVTRWQCNDGQMFDTEEEAKSHALFLRITAWVETWAYYDMSKCDIAHEIHSNRHKLREILCDD